jgi:hypothetical protein
MAKSALNLNIILFTFQQFHLICLFQQISTIQIALFNNMINHLLRITDLKLKEMALSNTSI